MGGFVEERQGNLQSKVEPGSAQIRCSPGWISFRSKMISRDAVKKDQRGIWGSQQRGTDDAAAACHSDP